MARTETTTRPPLSEPTPEIVEAARAYLAAKAVCVAMCFRKGAGLTPEFSEACKARRAAERALEKVMPAGKVRYLIDGHLVVREKRGKCGLEVFVRPL